jgi:hypothetical protein
MWGRMTLARPGRQTMPDFLMTPRVCNDGRAAYTAYCAMHAPPLQAADLPLQEATKHEIIGVAEPT